MGKNLPTYHLKRVKMTDKATLGVFIGDLFPLCVTLEDPWLGNETNISCIPEGEYIVEAFNGNKFKNVWKLQDVKDRTDILIHAGNTVKDTHGCILVGSTFNGNTISNSQSALDFLRDVLPDEFLLIIENV